MTDPNNARSRAREIGHIFRWDPDVWKPITPLAVVLSLVTAIGVFVATIYVGNWLYAVYAVHAGYEGTDPNLSVIPAIGFAFLALYTALNCRPTDWLTAVFACIAAALVVGIVICTMIAAASLLVVSGSTGDFNAALPYAVLISGIPGIPVTLGAVILLGRRPAAPAQVAAETEDPLKETEAVP